MMYSYQIEQAIRAACVLHSGQVRKGKAPYPYISHVVAVAFLLGDYTDDEDVVIAGLLHDTLEDTSYTPEELEKDFGARVRKIVEGVTECLREDRQSFSFEERKERYFAALRNAPPESLLVAAADKVHNMRSIVEEYQGSELRYRKDFSGSPKYALDNAERLRLMLNARIENEIVSEFNNVYEQYKEFLKAIT